MVKWVETYKHVDWYVHLCIHLCMRTYMHVQIHMWTLIHIHPSAHAYWHLGAFSDPHWTQRAYHFCLWASNRLRVSAAEGTADPRATGFRQGSFGIRSRRPLQRTQLNVSRENEDVASRSCSMPTLCYLPPSTVSRRKEPCSIWPLGAGRGQLPTTEPERHTDRWRSQDTSAGRTQDTKAGDTYSGDQAQWEFD